jgi:hypothetical protein
VRCLASAELNTCTRIALQSTLILSPHTGHRSGPFPSGSATRVLYSLLIVSIRATFPTSLIPLHLMVLQHVRCEVLTAVIMRILIQVEGHFSPEMEIACSSETSTRNYGSTRRHNPEQEYLVTCTDCAHISPVTISDNRTAVAMAAVGSIRIVTSVHALHLLSFVSRQKHTSHGLSFIVRTRKHSTRPKVTAAYNPGSRRCS